MRDSSHAQLQNECRTNGCSITIIIHFTSPTYQKVLHGLYYIFQLWILSKCQDPKHWEGLPPHSSPKPLQSQILFTLMTSMPSFSKALCVGISPASTATLLGPSMSVHGEPLGCHPEWMAVRNHRPWSINHFPASFDKEFLCLVAPSVWALHEQPGLQQC